MGRRRTRDAPIEIVLPITPMLDMSFQLLAFFILTFSAPSAAEGQMDMFLPAATVAKAESPADADPFAMTDANVEPDAEITITIESAGGEIDRMVIREREKTTPVATIAELRPVLDKIRDEIGKDRSATVKIEASRLLKYSALVQVMDTCLLAQFKSVGFAPPVAGRP